MSEHEAILIVNSLTKSYQKDGKALLALNEVSFDLRKGEVLGVIGRNGAGKSTLLKVLSQITGPTSGEISYDGQLTSIIDIGTGFHADLSGKENIFLSALLIGYSKKQISELYNEIVEFSGLEEFMDMPVKHYSSGMYLRLAFSIAFHSNISILLLDEVIAVGDTDFQRKCYSKIKELKNRGTGIVLVSHHLEVIVEHCDRALLFEAGKLIMEGNPMNVVNQYYELIEGNEGAQIRSALSQSSDSESFTILKEFPQKIDHFSIDTLKLVNHNSESKITTTDELVFRFFCTKIIDEGSFEIGIVLINLNGVRVLLDSYGFRKEYSVKDLATGQYEVDVLIPADLLSAGVYRIGVVMGVNREPIKEIDTIAKFRLLPDDAMEETRGMGSVIRPKLNWVINRLKN